MLDLNESLIKDLEEIFDENYLRNSFLEWINLMEIEYIDRDF